MVDPKAPSPSPSSPPRPTPSPPVGVVLLGKEHVQTLDDNHNHNDNKDNNKWDEITAMTVSLTDDLSSLSSKVRTSSAGGVQAMDFVEIYESLEFQSAMQTLRVAQQQQPPMKEDNNEDNDNNTTNTIPHPDIWAKAWALQMRHERKDAVALNRCRKVLLRLLYSLCDAWKQQQQENEPHSHSVATTTNTTNTSIATNSNDRILHEFGRERIVNILQLALPMDRAQALYKMVYAGATTYGMHWFAPQHVTRSPHYWQRIQDTCGGFPTMNKRYLWLYECDSLALPQHCPSIGRWLEPQLVPTEHHHQEQQGQQEKQEQHEKQPQQPPSSPLKTKKETTRLLDEDDASSKYLIQTANRLSFWIMEGMRQGDLAVPPKMTAIILDDDNPKYTLQYVEEQIQQFRAGLPRYNSSRIACQHYLTALARWRDTHHADASSRLLARDVHPEWHVMLECLCIISQIMKKNEELKKPLGYDADAQIQQMRQRYHEDEDDEEDLSKIRIGLPNWFLLLLCMITAWMVWYTNR